MPRRQSRPRPARTQDLSLVNTYNDLHSVDGLDPRSRRAATTNRYSPVLLLVALIAGVGVIARSSADISISPGTRGPAPARHRSGDGDADGSLLRTQGDNPAGEAVRRSQARKSPEQFSPVPSNFKTAPVRPLFLA